MVVKSKRSVPATKAPARTKSKPPVAKPAATKPAGKRGAKPSFLDRIASFAAPADAAGLARVPAGLAANPQAAALLGLGFPHLLVTVDEPLAALADFAAYKKHYLGALVLPRALPPIMYAIARSSPSVEELDKAVTSPPKPPKLDDAVTKALRYGGANIVAICEALFGAEPAADAFVSALDAASVEDLNGGKYENYGYAIVYALGWLLWRVPAGVRAKHRATLAGVLDRLRGAGELWRTGEALDVILNGRAGVERSGRGFQGKLFLSEFVWADDDPDWVASMAATKLHAIRPADREQFDIQLAVAGGPKVLALLRGATAKFMKDQRALIDAQLALCAP